MNWSRGERKYPFAYVGDVLALYINVSNIHDAYHHGKAFGVWRNYTLVGDALKNLSPLDVQIGDLPIDHYIPNSTTPLNHKSYFYVNASKEGISRVYMNISDYSGKLKDNSFFDVYVLDPSVSIQTSKTTYRYGENDTFIIKLKNNATDVEEIILNITHPTITSDGKVINVSDIYYADDFNISTLTNLSSFKFETNFSLNYTFFDSGTYYLDVRINLSNYPRTLHDKKIIYVEPGYINLEDNSPKYRILTKQTGSFNLTLQVKAGDIHNVTLKVIFTNTSLITPLGTTTFPLGNLTDGDEINLSIDISTHYHGLLSFFYTYNYTFNHTMQSFTSQKFPLEIVYPKIEIQRKTMNITQDNYMEIQIVGNLTPIDLVNTTINKTLFGYLTKMILPLEGIREESQCYAEESQSNTYVTPTSIINISDVSYAYRSIDGDNTTYTTFESFANGNANLTYVFPRSYVFTSISILGRTSYTSQIIHIYYYDEEASSFREVEDTQDNSFSVPLTTSETPEYVNISLIVPVRTSKLILAIEGSAVSYIHEVKFYLAKINSSYPCYVYATNIYSGFDDIINMSGYYNITSDVVQNNILIPSRDYFFVNFGKINITLDDTLGGNIYSSNENKTLKYIRICPENGDLYNIKIHLNITNTTLINFSNGETPWKNISYISYYDWESLCPREGKLIPYNLVSKTITNSQIVPINVSVWDLTTHSFESSMGEIKLYPNDTQPPNITWWGFAWENSNGGYVEYNSSNVEYPLGIVVNASDDIIITNITVQITSPKGETYNVTFTPSDITIIYGNDFSKGSFFVKVPSEYINETGKYNISVFVTDYGENTVEDNHTKEINITTHLITKVEPLASIYNRMQSLFVLAYLDNGLPLTEIFNTTLKFISGESNATFVFCSSISYSCNSTSEFNINYYTGGDYERAIQILIPTNNTPKAYRLDIEVKYFNNTGNFSLSFRTSNMLNATIYKLFDENGNLASTKVCVSHMNGYDPITYLDYGIIKCSISHVVRRLIPSLSPGCFIPEGDFTCDSSGYLIVNVSYNNNTAYLEEPVKSTTPSSSTPPISGGGGGSSGGGGGGGSKGIYLPPVQQNYTIPQLERIPRFSIVLKGTHIHIQQAEPGRNYSAYLVNEGDLPLDIDLNISTTCENCKVDIYPKHVHLDVGERKEFLFFIYAPLYQKAADKSVYIYASDKKLNYSKQSVLVVTIDEDKYFYLWKSVKDNINRVENLIAKFESENIDISKEKEMYRKALSLVDIARKKEREDKIYEYKNYLEQANALLSMAEKRLMGRLWFYKLMKNKYKVILGSIISGVLSAIFYLFIFPFVYYSIKINHLENRIKSIINSRIETEKQYFQRKIDEATFRGIMEKLQSQLIQKRKELDLVKERYHLLRSFKIINYMKAMLNTEKEDKEKKLWSMPQRLRSYKENRSLFERVSSRMARIIKGSGIRLKEVEKDLIRLLVNEPSHIIKWKKKSEEREQLEKKAVVMLFEKENEVDST